MSKILIVDDKKLNRKLLRSYLTDAGYTEIVEAASGQEAISKVEGEKPDLVLLDIVMPGMDGIEVCRLLKSKKETLIIPVIMVTALDDRKVKLKCLEMGADDFLNKPVDSMELTARVRSLLRVKDYYQQLRELNANLLANMETAQRIQRALLPRDFPNHKDVRFDAYYQPADLLGGDYYNVFNVGQDHICLYMADVSGHQLDAAMLTVFIKETVAGYFRKAGMGKNTFAPRNCLLALEEAFRGEEFPADIFITMFLAFYNCSSRELTYSAAGFAQPALLYGGERGLRELVCPGSPIMSLGEGKDFQEKSVSLAYGEGLLLYTDGVTEQTEHGGEEQFGEARLRFLLGEMNIKEAPMLVSTLRQKLSTFAGTQSFKDDIALLHMYFPLPD